MIIQKKAYAKINLCLKILDKLPNGYHNIYTVMQKISLCDDITININNIKPDEGQNINIICDNRNKRSSFNVPADKTNTAYKAAELFLGIAGIFADIEITIDKKIPVQAGLGGGSSDAASVLLGLNEYFDFMLPENRLIEIAANIGADVPFFVQNANCAVCEGIGEIITPIDMDIDMDMDLSEFYCAIVKPAYNISTRQAYEDWDRFAENKYNAGDKHEFRSRQSSLQKYGDVIKNIHNDFSGLIFSQNKNLKDIKDLLIKSGAAACELSGSGSALFGIFDNLECAQKCGDTVKQMQNIEFYDIFQFLY